MGARRFTAGPRAGQRDRDKESLGVERDVVIPTTQRLTVKATGSTVEAVEAS
jgi:hypothetical protein